MTPTEKNIKIETGLLKAMSIRSNFEGYGGKIDTKRLMPNTALLLKDYKKYYKIYKDHDKIDYDLFLTNFAQSWHKKDLDENDIEYYRDVVIPIIDKVESQAISNVMLSLLNRDYSERINDLVASGMDSNKIIETINEYRTQKQTYITDVDEEAFSLDKVDFSILDKANGIPWFLPTLQAGLGSLVQGQFVIVSADYGTGKSAFVISQAVQAFKHIHKTDNTQPILYFNSEGTTADVFCRFLSCLYSGKVVGGFEEVLTRIDEVREKFTAAYNLSNLLVFQVGCGDMPKIHQKIELYNPSLVIIDIADVLAPEEDVKTLKKLYDGLRLLSAKSCPIIATTQSGDTSYQDSKTKEIKTRKWLGDKALYGSKSGKGGAADTIITIGKDDDIPNIRYVNTPKKKRGTMVSTTCELIDKFSLYKELL